MRTFLRVLGIAALTALMLFGLYFGCSAWLLSQAEAEDFGTFHYPGPFPPSGCDSLCGPNGFYWADRMLYGVNGDGHAKPALDRNGNISWFVYNSLTDDGDPGAEDTAWEAYLTAEGETDEYERSFLHWAEDTVVKYESPFGNCFAVKWAAGTRVPAYYGCGGSYTCGASPTCPTGTQIGTVTISSCPCQPGTAKPLYDGATISPAPTRFYLCFSDSVGASGSRARVRQLKKEFFADWQMGTNGHIQNDTRWYKGIFLDNSAYSIYNWGAGIHSGGTVREAGAVIANTDASSFSVWYRGTASPQNGMLGFMAALRDTFDQAASWHSGGVALKVVPNVDLNFDQAYPAHIKLAETEGGIQGLDGDLPQRMWNASNGSRVWYSCPTNNLPAGWKYGTLVYGCYGLFKVTSTSDDIWGMQYNTNQCATAAFASDGRWNEKVWIAAIDSTLNSARAAYLGAPTSNPSVGWSGTYNCGNVANWKIWKRDYTGSPDRPAFVIARTKDQWCSATDSSSSIKTITLPTRPADKYWRLVLPNGQLGNIQFGDGATIDMPIMTARIFVSRSFQASGVTCRGTCEEIEEGGGKANSGDFSEVRWFDVRGRRLTERPASGIYIEERWTNGKRTSRKTLRVK